MDGTGWTDRAYFQKANLNGAAEKMTPVPDAAISTTIVDFEFSSKAAETS